MYVDLTILHSRRDNSFNYPHMFCFSKKKKKRLRYKQPRAILSFTLAFGCNIPLYSHMVALFRRTSIPVPKAAERDQAVGKLNCSTSAAETLRPSLCILRRYRAWQACLSLRFLALEIMSHGGSRLLLGVERHGGTLGGYNAACILLSIKSSKTEALFSQTPKKDQNSPSSL